jgi:hypothetical protein
LSRIVHNRSVELHKEFFVQDRFVKLVLNITKEQTLQLIKREIRTDFGSNLPEPNNELQQTYFLISNSFLGDVVLVHEEEFLFDSGMLHSLPEVLA